MRPLSTWYVAARLPVLLSVALFAWALTGGSAFAQDAVLGNPTENEIVGEGWSGFTNVFFLLHALLALILAAVLGSVIAYHPRSRRAIDTIEESDAPKIYITYSVVGAVIGIMVVQYGLVIGFVVFGIGGLIRFRTNLPSATETGRLIFVTLIGLSAGLDLPHLAVLATVFSFALIYILDARLTYRIKVMGISEDHVEDVAAAYLKALEQQRYRVVQERKSPSKGEVALVFQTPSKVTREQIEARFDASIPQRYRGMVDWEIN